MSKKNNATIESAKIALYGTIIVAVIGIITATISSYSNYMSNRIQVELPIISTQTAEARFAAETQTASPNISVKTQSYASIIIQNLFNQNLISTSSGTVIWEEKEYSAKTKDTNVMAAVSTNFAPANFVFFSNVSWESDDSELTACGFDFRSNNLRTHYTTLLRRNGNIVLWLFSANGGGELVSEIIQGINKENNQANNLLLIVEGSSFTLLVNDSVAYETMDQTLSTGFIAKVIGSGPNDINTCTFSDSWLWEIE